MRAPLSHSSLTIPVSSRILDRVEQGLVLILYSWLVVRLWPESVSPKDWYPLLLLISEGLVVVFLLIRRPTEQISLDARDWFVAAAGTFLVLLVDTGGEPIALQLGFNLILIGIFIHVGAKLSLRRSFGLVAANRGIKDRGLYRFVRHPMYAGYMMSHIGFLLIAPSLWNLAIYAAAWSFLIARIFAEERTLRQDPKYQDYMERVSRRLIPGVF